MILSDNVDYISQEIIKFQNILAFVKTSTLHHLALDQTTLRSIIDKLHIINLDIREYYDIIKVRLFYVGNEIVLVFQFPIVISFIYNLYQLSMIPNKYHQVLSPTFPFLVIHEKEFRYIEAECPKASKWHLCIEKPNYLNQS